MNVSVQQPDIAVVIPALNGEISALRASLERQTWQPSQVEVAVGVRPNGRARNVATARTLSPYLVFIDDDAVLANDDALERLVAPLLADPTIGVTGAAKLLPPESSWFQRWVGREVPRIEHAVVDENPDPPSFYSEITTTCCALRRAVYDEVGGFDNELVRGVDTEFFLRVRRAGYRFILVPRTWTWHPAPANLRALLRKHWLYGVGHAQEVRRDPSRARGRRLSSPWRALAYLAFRTAILPVNIFLPYSFAAPSWRLGFKPLKALTSYVGALGYTWESVAEGRRIKAKG
jgi:cellulose synthase/poly-beta-1,6-N-acetylglucosamine synthase-like glycosyltransferase